jgi:hypothetical protein
MSTQPPTQFQSTEGVLLIRQNGVTMAVHLTSVTAILTAVVNEPDIQASRAWWYTSLPTLDHYDVEATGTADRIHVWQGPDPFAKPELDSPRARLEDTR